MTTTVQFSEHPEYQANYEKWQALQDFYEGDHNTLVNSKYLVLHELETFAQGANLRRIREERTQYVNDMELVVSRYIAMIYLEDPDLTEVEGLFTELGLNDVDGKGTTFNEFIRDQLLVHMFLLGRPRVLVDSFNMQVPSLAEERQFGLRPYFEMLSRLSVVDWQIETDDPARMGKYNFLRYEYDCVEPRTDATEKAKSFRGCTVYRRLPTGGYSVTRYKKKPHTKGSWEQIDEAPVVVTQIDEIPIVSIERAESWCKDIVAPIRTVFNSESNLDNQLLFQGHTRMFVLGEVGPEDRKAAAASTLGVFPEGTTIQVIGPSDPVALDRRIDKGRSSIMRLAFNKMRFIPADSKEAEGAASQAEGNKDFVALVKSIIQQVQDFTNKLVKLYAEFRGKKNFVGMVKFNKDVTPEFVDEQLKILSTFWSRWEQRSPTLMKEVDKKFATKLNLPNQETILKELDEAVEPDPQEQLEEDPLLRYADGGQQALKLADRVRVKPGENHDSMSKDATGEVAIVSTPALGIKFENMAEVHKWYVESELEKVEGSENGSPARAVKKPMKM